MDYRIFRSVFWAVFWALLAWTALLYIVACLVVRLELLDFFRSMPALSS